MKAIQDLINGNITDAKKAARNRTFFSILNVAQVDHGMSALDAYQVASFLKGHISFQQYCEKTIPDYEQI
jgi:hypothetical protein